METAGEDQVTLNGFAGDPDGALSFDPCSSFKVQTQSVTDTNTRGCYSFGSGTLELNADLTTIPAQAKVGIRAE